MMALMIPVPSSIPLCSTSAVLTSVLLLLAAPLVPKPTVRRMLVAFSLAVLAVSIIVPSCCNSWCWLDPICWW